MAREDDNAGPTLLAISIVVLILVMSTTAMRLAVRASRSALGGDDYNIAAASLLVIGRITCQIISVQHGNGRHAEFIDTPDYQYINFLTWLTQLFLFPILCCLKSSVCLLVLRVKNTKPLRYGLWSLISLLVLTTLLPMIVLLAECSPVSAYWKGDTDSCWDPKVRIYSIYLQTSVSVFADVVCTLLPIAVVYNLTLSLQNKIAVCALMSLGVVSTCFACVRASSLGLSTSDLSWEYCWAAIWGNIELGFGILGANLALSRTYWDFFKRGLDSVSSKTRSNKFNTRAGAYAMGSNVRRSKMPPGSAGGGDRTWDGGKATKVQCRGQPNGSISSDETDEVPFGPGSHGMGIGVKREIEFSVEADARSGLHEHGWGPDAERDGSRCEQREVAMGRAF